MSYFSELYTEIKYPIATEHSAGLRNAQIGAIHAIASHSTLEPLDAAVIVMPTGSGKTTVLMLAPYLLQKSKILIVTPSAMVRGQIADDYKQLKTLKAIGVFCTDVTPPKVYEAEHLFSAEQTNDISDADVVIASHQVAASISESEIKLLFDYVIIDEAHHVPAPTWQKIINNMKHAASLLVTATPFRLDKKEIQGTHIYNYPLSKAYRDGIFGSISFIPIDEAPNKDSLIAVEAERVLLNDRADGYDHYLMVRTDTKEKAKGLEELYKAKTSLRLKRIDSSMSFGTVQRTIKSLRGKELDGIICVDMLGEGFDFPNLKIAAIHEPQKSLASTLQFIGRFARTNAENIGTAKFIAMNDEALRIENRKLYTSDAVWQDMIIEMSEEKINCDLENSEAIKQFSRPENGQDTISLHNIRPNCHARVYRVTDFNLEGVFPEELSVGENIYRSGDTNTIVGIATTNDTPLWLESNQPLNTAVNLYIVHYQTETGLLFIYSQQKTEVIYESIADSFCESHTKIPRNEMNRVLAGFSNYEFFNTGMQNRYAEAGESYRIYAGSNTAASIDETTGMMLSAGHAFCKVNQGGTDATIGYSSGSKFWSSSYLPIPEYVSWCDTFGKKIVHRNFDDNFPLEFNNALNALNRFLYLTDMHRIIVSCASDFLNLQGGEEVEFWQINKYFLNYLNAVYSYKEFVNSYDPPLKEITDGYYYKRRWYRFICDYRNRVIHQSTIIKDRSNETGDVFINIDEIIEIQEAVIADITAERDGEKDPKKKEKYKKQIENAERFLREIKALLSDPVLVQRGYHFKSMKSVITDANIEIQQMNDEILAYSFNKGVRPALERLLSWSYESSEGYQYSFIVNKQYINFPGKEDIACFEPTYAIEDFYKNMLRSLGKESVICKTILNFLLSHNYLYSYDEKCCINFFPEKYAL